jgi:hypothetical protein
MKTAIEWYYNEMVKFQKGNSEFFSSAAIYNHAFIMEKEQIIQAHIDGFDHIVVDFKKQEYAEQYYNQTYNQKQHIIDIMKADENDGLYNQNES